MRNTRRQFLARLGGAAACAPLFPAAAREAGLNGKWLFRLDPLDQGEAQGWQGAGPAGAGWSEVQVPHTWQIDPPTAGYQGVAWYRRVIPAPAAWSGQALRAEFEAVYHTARVWVNGQPAGAHVGKGYTPFTIDLTPFVEPGRDLTLAVRVDNSYDWDMLPRGKSFDWTPDGGIYRPVNLLVTPPGFIERVEVEALPDLAAGTAEVRVTLAVRNNSRAPVSLPLEYRITAGGPVLATGRALQPVTLAAGEAREIQVPTSLGSVRLWHFDDPFQYRLTADFGEHTLSTRFGVRRFEARDGGFHLNGERVRLMGVERMAGSNPNYGMAEPRSWIDHDHDDLKLLNCVFTRVHWPQDRRVLEYCDRHGILIQEEVPAWGPETFRGMGAEPAQALLANGLGQLREMIHAHRNHPSVCAWGLCNEVNGQHPAARRFIQALRDEARKLDPHRLLTYASNSLQKTPERDAAGLLDFISWNEYYESWYGGTVPDVRRNLEEIHRAFPDKPVVISEYGYCECDPRHTGGDLRRVEVLRTHDQVYRAFPWVAGAIFFDYNDYRTHIGDKGIGPLRQRVHGVVDLFGNRKPSFQALRGESSPVAGLVLRQEGRWLLARVSARRDLPSYPLSGYRVRWISYASGGLPLEEDSVALPPVRPGAEASVILRPRLPNPERIKVDVLRPTGFSAATANWPE